MVSVSIEGEQETVRLLVFARAENIRRSLELVKQRYPDGEARVVFPLDPETFPIFDSTVETESVL